MDFDFTEYIHIEETDLHEMYKRVKWGERFDDVYEDIMERYPDWEYECRYCIINQVREEINYRLKQSKNNC